MRNHFLQRSTKGVEKKVHNIRKLKKINRENNELNLLKNMKIFYKTKKVLLLDTWSGFNRAILSENIKYASLPKIY